MGATDTFEELCLAIEAPLYSYALRLTGNASDAEELAQEALVRLFHALHGGKLKQAPRAYAFSIAHNLAMAQFRAQRHRAPASSAMPHTPAPLDGRIVPLHPQTTPAPSRTTERFLLRAELDKALNELPQDQRAALLLREFGEMSYQEIAQTLGAPLAQVKIWIYRARKKLALLLDRDGQYIGNSHHGT